MTIFKNRYNLSKIFFCVFGLLLIGSFSNLLHAQINEFEPVFHYQRSLSIQKSGMIVLGSWASLNILSGLAGNHFMNGEGKYFFQMNAAWNLVNLGIAGFGLFNAMNASLSIEELEMVQEMRKLDRILLINSGLDVLYIATGAYLLNRGISKSSARQIGYGRSLMLQGGFLLLFDLALYYIHSGHTKTIYHLTENISVTTAGLTLHW
jgi:hypothetical protein